MSDHEYVGSVDLLLESIKSRQILPQPASDSIERLLRQLTIPWNESFMMIAE